jgi:hypothetical protein
MTRHPFLRFLTLLFAAAQFALPGLAAISEGEFGRGDRQTGMHVEAVGGRDCTPPHSADCGVCRYMTTQFTRADHGPIDFSGFALRSAPRDIDRGQASASLDRLPPSRAPPSL